MECERHKAKTKTLKQPAVCDKFHIRIEKNAERTAVYAECSMLAWKRFNMLNSMNVFSQHFLLRASHALGRILDTIFISFHSSFSLWLQFARCRCVRDAIY